MTQTMKSLCSAIALLLTISAGCSGGGSGASAPAAPSELKAAELEGGAHLTWKDNSNDESGFMIERKVGSGAFTTLSTVPFNTTQYHDPNLTTGTVYTYHVMAMGKEAGKDSDFSSEVTFMLAAAPSHDGGISNDGDASSDGGDHASHHAERRPETIRVRSIASGSVIPKADCQVDQPCLQRSRFAFHPFANARAQVLPGEG